MRSTGAPCRSVGHRSGRDEAHAGRPAADWDLSHDAIGPERAPNILLTMPASATRVRSAGRSAPKRGNSALRPRPDGCRRAVIVRMSATVGPSQANSAGVGRPASRAVGVPSGGAAAVDSQARSLSAVGVTAAVLAILILAGVSVVSAATSNHVEHPTATALFYGYLGRGVIACWAVLVSTASEQCVRTAARRVRPVCLGRVRGSRRTGRSRSTSACSPRPWHSC